jgi:hypothetical protein
MKKNPLNQETSDMVRIMRSSANKYKKHSLPKIHPNAKHENAQHLLEDGVDNIATDSRTCEYQKMPFTILPPIVAPAPKIAAFPSFLPNFLPPCSNLLGSPGVCCAGADAAPFDTSSGMLP